MVILDMLTGKPHRTGKPQCFATAGFATASKIDVGKEQQKKPKKTFAPTFSATLPALADGGDG